MANFDYITDKDKLKIKENQRKTVGDIIKYKLTLGFKVSEIRKQLNITQLEFDRILLSSGILGKKWEPGQIDMEVSIEAKLLEQN